MYERKRCDQGKGDAAMAKRRRISKKKLKEPDEFVSTAARMILWTKENLRLILYFIALLRS